jgi:hypothetical protein
LRGYGIEGERAERANGSATLVAVVVTILAAMAVLFAAALVVIGVG